MSAVCVRTACCYRRQANLRLDWQSGMSTDPHSHRASTCNFLGWTLLNLRSCKQVTHNQGFLPKYDVWDFKARYSPHATVRCFAAAC